MNTLVGVAQSIIKNLKKDTEYFIVEMGAYKKGEIKAICDLVHPQYAILTAIGNQHLDLFGSKEKLIAAKSELPQALTKDGTFYINKDIPEYQNIIKKTNCKIHSYSPRELRIKTTLPADYLINLAPCVALAYDLNLPQQTLTSAVKQLKPLTGKLSPHRGINNSFVLNDSYNSSPEGFILAIKTALNKPLKQKIIVSRGIIELGKEKISSYKRIVEELNKTSILLYTTDRLFKQLETKKNIMLFNQEKKILDQLKKTLNKDSLLVIEGKFPEYFIKQLILYDLN